MTTTTTNGTVSFIDNAQDAAKSMLADMVALENANNSEASSEVLPILGALTGIIGNAIAAGQFGLNVASAANSSNGLEIEIKNQGSNYIAPYSYKTENVNVSGFPGPIVPGESDSFVITPDGKFQPGSTMVKLNMLISGDTPDNFVPVKITFSLTDSNSPALWQFKIFVDGKDHSFSADKGIVCVQYAGNSGYPSFNLYVGAIETGGGEMSLTVFDPA